MDTNNLFSDDQKKVVVDFLNDNCVGTECLSRSEVYNAVQAVLGDTSEVVFAAWLSAVINSGEVSGFETRKGRSGGICRAGAFEQVDADRKASKQSKYKTLVEVDGSRLVAAAKPDLLRKYVVEVLDGQEATDGNVKVEDMVFTCDGTLFRKYLTAIVGTTDAPALAKTA